VESEKSAGDSCHNQKMYAEAIKHYSQALHKSPSGDARNAVLFNNRAQCYIKLEQYRRALDDCEEALRLDSKNIKAFIRKGDCLYKIGDYETSRQAYTHAIRLDANNTWRDHINKALLLLPPSSVPYPSASAASQQASQAPPPVHRTYPQQSPLHPQQARAPPGPYGNIPRQTQFMPQYPGYAYQNNNNAYHPQQANNGAQDRRRAPDTEGCLVQ